METESSAGWLSEVTEDMLPTAHQKLAQVIGLEATLELCGMYGGSNQYIPTLDAVYDAVKRKRIRAEFAEGKTNVSTLARKYETTERTIQRMVEDIRPEQLSVFDIMNEINDGD